MKSKFHTRRIHLPSVGRTLTITAMVVKGGYVVKTQNGKHIPASAIVSVGYAVQNPNDEKEDEELAEKISQGRAQKNPVVFCSVQSYTVSPAFVNGLMRLVEDEFEQRFSSFVPLGKNASKTLQPGKTAMELIAKVDSDTTD